MRTKFLIQRYLSLPNVATPLNTYTLYPPFPCFYPFLALVLSYLPPSLALGLG